MPRRVVNNNDRGAAARAWAKSSVPSERPGGRGGRRREKGREGTSGEGRRGRKGREGRERRQGRREGRQGRKGRKGSEGKGREGARSPAQRPPPAPRPLRAPRPAPRPPRPAGNGPERPQTAPSGPERPQKAPEPSAASIPADHGAADPGEPPTAARAALLHGLDFKFPRARTHPHGKASLYEAARTRDAGTLPRGTIFFPSYYPVRFLL